MRPDAEFEAVQQLIRAGLNDCAISRATGIPRGTIRDWRHQQDRDTRDSRARPRTKVGRTGTCPICQAGVLDRPWYAYLLGLYLGDGCISSMPRGVYTLRVALDNAYPEIIDECYEAMARVRGINTHPPNIVPALGCCSVTSYWKHWPCVFPQHGPGPKHLRPIVLDHWQRTIASAYPERLLRGLIHSDGCRDRNVVKGKSYPRYSFCNESHDIKGIFVDACDQLGLNWTTPNHKVVAISRRRDVAKLDSFVGPKSDPTPFPTAFPTCLLEWRPSHEGVDEADKI